jgi:hypothetical protein
LELRFKIRKNRRKTKKRNSTKIIIWPQELNNK